MSPRVIVFFLFFAFIFQIKAQDHAIKFQRLKMQNGPRTGIKRIYQDKQGYIWFGTPTSLSRFDGYTVRYYRESELSTDQFVSKSAELVFEDSKDRLWIATDGGALMIYNKDFDRFEAVNDSLHSLKKDASSYVEDDLGNFWIGTKG